ncbi:hypothetical protein, partial [uncultured Gammaproteobacteria bacterium]
CKQVKTISECQLKMSTKIQIEWAKKIWNPTTGCTKVSAGC